MRHTERLNEYLTYLNDAGVPVKADPGLAPAYRLSLAAADWAKAAAIAFDLGMRWAGVWGDPRDQRIDVHALLVQGNDYLVLHAWVPLDAPELPSQVPVYPRANRLERHLMDLLGVRFSDHPDRRRWTRHLAWGEDEFPLRPEFPVSGHPPARVPADSDYPFKTIGGAGVYEIPVGPVHAGIIEPGHFRFQAVGEEVLRLEQHLGYVHKGVEKIAVGRDPDGVARLAGRVSGDSTVVHAWAACQAMERAAEAGPPARAQALRAVAAERERIANHLGDIGAICNDVGFAFAHVQCARLREDWQRDSERVFGHRMMMDCVVPGGFGVDPSLEDIGQLRAANARLRTAIEPLFSVINDHASLQDRLLSTGYLAVDDACQLGCTGYVGKASGQRFDVRADAPYAPYDHLKVAVPVAEEGDVAARVWVRMEEVRASLNLLEQLYANMPDGKVREALPTPAANAVGLGVIDGWRGEIVAFVRFDQQGRIARFFPRDPSWFTWPALERLLHGNIVPDFPVCNKSVNGSYSGHDL